MNIKNYEQKLATITNIPIWWDAFLSHNGAS